MKRNVVLSLCIIAVAMAILFCGCSADLAKLENAEIRQITEQMLDALIADNRQDSYALVQHICSEEDFMPIFTQMQDMLQAAQTYELQLRSIYQNTSISNGTKLHMVSSVYEMTTPNNRLIVSIRMDDQIGLTNFNLAPYELTDYYYTGTLDALENTTPVQWVFLLLNVIAIGFVAFTITDCCRQNIKKKGLWILLVVLGFVSVGLTMSAQAIRFNFNLAWLTAYSALIRYGSGAFVARVMLPIGAFIYWIQRRSLLQANTPLVVVNEENLETAAATSVEQPSIEALEDSQV